MEKGRQTDVMVMDFAKALNKVNHSLLIHTLHHYGIRNFINSWIFIFLNNRRQAVVVDGAKSGHIPVRSGVPQGSVLGPGLFLIYIKNLATRVSSLTHLYADDTVLYWYSAASEDHATFQADLGKLGFGG